MNRKLFIVYIEHVDDKKRRPFYRELIMATSAAEARKLHSLYREGKYSRFYAKCIGYGEMFLKKGIIMREGDL